MAFLTGVVFWVALLIMLVGLLTVLIPVMPGLVIMWLAALAYGVIHGFSALGILLMVVITVLTLVGTLIDNVLMGAGARKGGASWTTILVALLAGLLGTLFFPPFGGFIAAPLAVLLLEYYRLGDIKKALQALKGLATGLGASIVVRFVIGLTILGLWGIWVWKG